MHGPNVHFRAFGLLPAQIVQVAFSIMRVHLFILFNLDPVQFQLFLIHIPIWDMKLTQETILYIHNFHISA